VISAGGDWEGDAAQIIARLWPVKAAAI